MKKILSIIAFTVAFTGAVLAGYTTTETVTVQKSGGDNPKSFVLDQNYPNPFNPETNIRYQLPVSGQVRLSVFNLLGVEVAVLVDDYQSAGTYNVHFNASSFQSGVYLYKLKVGNTTITRKMTLLK
ncbi:MAG: T9SS type A sorting domain-containing protein [Ignavibacteriales bacterium]|jgi:hypothetical protein|nr:MAG: T9SS type A sorting domain-containing protein [Ignavibacteriaceae bacterium]MBW7872550.1 T9SS type A sorting domain-containing protein [Ignavibacteria bacterium]MCZ2141897.1 T9SS type A sorting domain-containing protein [Ignavibacteriales bacterium]MBV6445064.1 hypothetical protein [Ignavibacteriaceae bacterium]MBZ0196641.1 T9SS type A sorting domain-containing protein [Ignavibacteriaceae bacterium]